MHLAFNRTNNKKLFFLFIISIILIDQLKNYRPDFKTSVMLRYELSLSDMAQAQAIFLLNEVEAEIYLKYIDYKYYTFETATIYRKAQHCQKNFQQDRQT